MWLALRKCCLCGCACVRVRVGQHAALTDRRHFSNEKKMPRKSQRKPHLLETMGPLVAEQAMQALPIWVLRRAQAVQDVPHHVRLETSPYSKDWLAPCQTSSLLDCHTLSQPCSRPRTSQRSYGAMTMLLPTVVPRFSLILCFSGLKCDCVSSVYTVSSVHSPLMEIGV